MADSNTRRLSPDERQADLDAFTALGGLKTYTPPNTKFTLAEVTTSKTAMEAAQLAEFKATKDLETARDNATAAEYAFHQKMLGAKDQVIAQFGKDSNEIQTLGLKKKSEYDKPKRKSKKDDSPAK